MSSLKDQSVENQGMSGTYKMLLKSRLNLLHVDTSERFVQKYLLSNLKTTAEAMAARRRTMLASLRLVPGGMGPDFFFTFASLDFQHLRKKSLAF